MVNCCGGIGVGVGVGVGVGIGVAVAVGVGDAGTWVGVGGATGAQATSTLTNRLATTKSLDCIGAIITYSRSFGNGAAPQALAHAYVALDRGGYV